MQNLKLELLCVLPLQGLTGNCAVAHDRPFDQCKCAYLNEILGQCPQWWKILNATGRR